MIRYRLYNTSGSAVYGARDLCYTSLPQGITDTNLLCSHESSKPMSTLDGRLGILTARADGDKAFRVGYVASQVPTGRVDRDWIVTRLVTVNSSMATPELQQQDIVYQVPTSGEAVFNRANVSLAMDPDCGKDYLVVWPMCDTKQSSCAWTDGHSKGGGDTMRLDRRLLPWPMP